MESLAPLRAGDVQACYRVVGECRDLGADASSWQAHLIERLRGLVRAQVVIGGNTLHFGSRGHVGKGGPTPLSSDRVGWPSAEAEQSWRDYASEVPIDRTPEYARLAAMTGANGTSVTLSRDDIWDRGAWYRSRTFNERHRRSGIDHYVISIHSIPSLDLAHSLWVHRAVGDRPFGVRERDLVRLLHSEIGRLIGGALASACEPSLAGLTRRQREVLDSLLRGDSEKQTACRLGLRRPTVHEHVTSLYRHFGARSRGELMAHFIGRARPAPPGAPIQSDGLLIAHQEPESK